MYRLYLKECSKGALSKALQQQSCRRYNKINKPQIQEAGFAKYVFFLSPVIVAGGAISYAKYDPEFRKTLEKNVPGAESVIKVVLQEEKNPLSDIKDSFNSMTKPITEAVDSINSTVSSFFGSSEKSTEEKKPKKDVSLPFATENITTLKSNKKMSNELKGTTSNLTASSPSEEQTTTTAAIKSKAAIKKSESSKTTTESSLTDNIMELEKSVELAASLAVKEYHKAIKVLKSFNDDVRKVVDNAVENIDTSKWMSLKNKTSARDSAVATAEKLAREAIDKLEKYEIELSKVASAVNHGKVVSLRERIKALYDHINVVKDELYKHKDIATMSEKYWRNVEKARNYFVDEIESIFPGINLSENKLNLPKEDMDLFITHAYSHVLAYQKELERLQTEGELRLKRAVDAFRANNDTEAVKAQLEYQLETEKRKLAIENQKKLFQIRAESERQLRQHLKQQAEAHIDHLNDAIAIKESELKRNYNREMEDKLALEKANYKLQLATMLGKMRGMDAALQARAESERSAHQAQALWAACQSLWSTIRNGEPGVHWRYKLRPLKNELKAISKVAEGDELVAVVIQNMPTEAGDRGVFPEEALRERFLNVENIARKVALVPENGASIPMYILSFLQSLFILKPKDPITAEELEDREFDYSKLDTYEILNRARYYVDRGNLMQALKYMNLLQGAPRKLASEWINETRLLLETQQAANTLMAHAAASGLLYL